MESSEVDLKLDLFKKVEEYLVYIKSIEPSWSEIKWSAYGPSNLFAEFTRIAGWTDSLSSKITGFEERLNNYRSAFVVLKDRFQQSLDKVMAENSKKWIQLGYAHQEREALAKIEVGEEYRAVLEIERRISDIVSMISILRSKLIQLNSFKSDAKSALEMMKFGHQLGELK